MGLFGLWFTKHFLQNTSPAKPLLFDGHSLLHPVATDYAKEYAVIFLYYKCLMLLLSSHLLATCMP